jgi:hypothetical protein
MFEIHIHDVYHEYEINSETDVSRTGFDHNRAINIWAKCMPLAQKLPQHYHYVRHDYVIA